MGGYKPHWTDRSWRYSGANGVSSTAPSRWLIVCHGMGANDRLYILGSFLTTAEEPHPLDTA